MTVFIDLVQVCGKPVYLKHDPEQLARMVTCIQFATEDEIYYQLSSGTRTSWHKGFELSLEKDMAIALTTSSKND